MTSAQHDVRAKGAELGGGGRFRRLMQGWSANLVFIILELSASSFCWSRSSCVSGRGRCWRHGWSSMRPGASRSSQMRDCNCAPSTGFLPSRPVAIVTDGPQTTMPPCCGSMLRSTSGSACWCSWALSFCRHPGFSGFHAMASFDSALLVMTVGALLALPANLVSGLYRARGRYSRSVWLQNGALLFGQIAQLIALVTNGGLVAVAVAFVSPQILLMIYLVAYDAPRLFPSCVRAAAAGPGAGGSASFAAPFLLPSRTCPNWRW